MMTALAELVSFVLAIRLCSRELKKYQNLLMLGLVRQARLMAATEGQLAFREGQKDLWHLQ